MQFAVTHVTVGYTFIVIIFANKLIDNCKRTQVLGTVNLVRKRKSLFFNLNNSEFEAFTSGLSILPKKRLHEPAIFEKINAFTENEETSCKYHKIDQLNKINIANLSLIHLNISSLPYHFA